MNNHVTRNYHTEDYHYEQNCRIRRAIENAYPTAYPWKLWLLETAQKLQISKTMVQKRFQKGQLKVERIVINRRVVLVLP